jgi:uncharacterized protein YjaG (DUF416 family)
VDPTNTSFPPFPPYVMYVTRRPALRNNSVKKEPDLASYVSLCVKKMNNYLKLSEPLSAKHFSNSRYKQREKIKKDIEIDVFNLFKKIKEAEKNPIDCFHDERKDILLRYLALCSDDSFYLKG